MTIWLPATPNGGTDPSFWALGWLIQNDMDDFERQAAYAADITYGTDRVLRRLPGDNMKFDLATCAAWSLLRTATS
jgi:hypothetical protein